MVSQIKKLSEAKINQLIENLSSPGTAEAADGALVKKGKQAVPFLKDALYDGTEVKRERVLICLGNMGDKASGALSTIRAIAKEDEEKIGSRFAAVWAIGNIASKLNNYPEINATVTELTAALKHYNSHMRYCAAEALGKIGSRAKFAIPELEARLNDEDNTVKHYAKWALSQIDPKLYAKYKDIKKPAEKTYKELINSIQEAKNEEERLKNNK